MFWLDALKHHYQLSQRCHRRRSIRTMVNQLLPLITPSPSNPPTTPALRREAQETSVRSSARRLVQLLTPSFHNAQARSQQTPLFSTPQITRHQIDNNTPSTGVVSSPIRTRRSSASAVPTDAVGDTPRRGRKAKQRRGDSSSEELDGLLQRWTQRNYSGLNIYDKPSTAFLGWRRLRLKQRRCSATEHQSIHDA